MTSRELQFEPSIDIPWLSIGVLGSAGLVIFENNLAPDHCRWCNPPKLDSRLRNQLMWSKPELAQSLSHLSAYGLLPLTMIGLSYFDDEIQRKNQSSLWMDATLLIEAATTAEILAKSIQFMSGRKRPLAFFDQNKSIEPEDHTSFVSGHTSVAFAMAVTAGSYAQARGSRFSPWIWTSGLSLAATTAYLRMASDHHYFTDVLMGAALGSSVGFLVPYLRFQWNGPYQRDARIQLTPISHGLAAQMRW